MEHIKLQYAFMYPFVSTGFTAKFGSAKGV
jgi:hypothetical protein